ncbi:hypothetical protein SHL15_2997 [Streptomyces hygroscopicus subsp. limoneus]|nr:hypothetical protein SHL15_2997 [Streptomyces hygroscopicus subsp. limoneus]
MADKAAPPLATLRIGVYRVNRETGEKTVIKPDRVIEAGEVLMTSEYPPCQCFLCQAKNR